MKSTQPKKISYFVNESKQNGLVQLIIRKVRRENEWMCVCVYDDEDSSL